VGLGWTKCFLPLQKLVKYRFLDTTSTSAERKNKETKCRPSISTAERATKEKGKE